MIGNHGLEILRLPCKLIIQTLSEFFSHWFVQRMNLFFMCENLSRFLKNMNRMPKKSQATMNCASIGVSNFHPLRQ